MAVASCGPFFEGTKWGAVWATTKQSGVDSLARDTRYTYRRLTVAFF